MSSLVESFIQTPSVSVLDKCTKDQLVKIADYYNIEIPDKRTKVRIKLFLVDNLMAQQVLPDEEVPSEDDVQNEANAQDGKTFSFSSGHLSFEQQKELLEIKLKHEKEMEIMKQKTELLRLELEQEKFNLGVKDKKQLNIGSNLQLLPKFSEKDPDLFFSLFERLAESRGWSDSERTLLLQCVLTGKAQEAYVSLTVAESQKYDVVKSAVLRAYELVPEAYRQRFRNLSKNEDQTHVEFVREMLVQFNRWCLASEVKTFKELADLITPEQFKNCVPATVATYINERKVKTPQEAAVLADEYYLTHKSFGEDCGMHQSSGPGCRPTVKHFVAQGVSDYAQGEPSSSKQDDLDTCHYCHSKGHWKMHCPAIKTKEKLSGAAQIKPVALAAPVVPLNKAVYSAFISKGYVSLPGGKAVAVNILRDTGALQTYIRQAVIPFSSVSDTGDFMLMRGMGMKIVPVSLHRLRLVCGLVTGEVVVGVRPELPVEGVDIILGNDLAGDKVWAEAQSPVGTDGPELQPLCSERLGIGVSEPLRRTMSPRKGKADAKTCSIPVPLGSVSRADLVREQRSDPSLRALFNSVSPVKDIETAAHGCFVENEVLVRKWRVKGEDGVEKPTLQIVVPATLRDMVLKASTDGVTGYMTCRKMYKQIRQNFFWPLLKRDVWFVFIKTCNARSVRTAKRSLI